MKQRRQFLINAPLGLLAVAEAVRAEPLPQDGATPAPAAPATTPGAPPTFGATPGFGPQVTPATFAEAEKLMQVTNTPATDVDRAALEAIRRLGMTAVPVTLPDWPYQSLNTVLFAEAAAAFEEITLDGRVDQLKAQVPDAWPNLFREARFLSAVDFVQADRLRRKVALEMARIFRQVDVLLVPSLRDEMLTISNNTGHPSLTLRTGTVEVGQARSDWAPNPAQPLPTFAPPRRVPHGVTLIGRLFDEGTIARVGLALEKEAGVAAERPPGF